MMQWHYCRESVIRPFPMLNCSQCCMFGVDTNFDPIQMLDLYFRKEKAVRESMRRWAPFMGRQIDYRSVGGVEHDYDCCCWPDVSAAGDEMLAEIKRLREENRSFQKTICKLTDIIFETKKETDANS